ncbi:hypothetical protein [Modicisalibacter luteus]
MGMRLARRQAPRRLDAARWDGASSLWADSLGKERSRQRVFFGASA